MNFAGAAWKDTLMTLRRKTQECFSSTDRQRLNVRRDPGRVHWEPHLELRGVRPGAQAMIRSGTVISRFRVLPPASVPRTGGRGGDAPTGRK